MDYESARQAYAEARQVLLTQQAAWKAAADKEALRPALEAAAARLRSAHAKLRGFWTTNPVLFRGAIVRALLSLSPGATDAQVTQRYLKLKEALSRKSLGIADQEEWLAEVAVLLDPVVKRNRPRIAHLFRDRYAMDRSVPDLEVLQIHEDEFRSAFHEFVTAVVNLRN